MDRQKVKIKLFNRKLFLYESLTGEFMDFVQFQLENGLNPDPELQLRNAVIKIYQALMPNIEFTPKYRLLKRYRLKKLITIDKISRLDYSVFVDLLNKIDSFVEKTESEGESEFLEAEAAYSLIIHFFPPIFKNSKLSAIEEIKNMPVSVYNMYVRQARNIMIGQSGGKFIPSAGKNRQLYKDMIALEEIKELAKKRPEYWQDVIEESEAKWKAENGIII